MPLVHFCEAVLRRGGLGFIACIKVRRLQIRTASNISVRLPRAAFSHMHALEHFSARRPDGGLSICCRYLLHRHFLFQWRRDRQLKLRVVFKGRLQTREHWQYLVRFQRNPLEQYDLSPPRIAGSVGNGPPWPLLKLAFSPEHLHVSSSTALTLQPTDLNTARIIPQTDVSNYVHSLMS